VRSIEQFTGLGRSLQRAWIKGAGFTDEELAQPLVLIANTYQDFSPENAHLRQVVDAVKAGVRRATIENVTTGPYCRTVRRGRCWRSRNGVPSPRCGFPEQSPTPFAGEMRKPAAVVGAIDRALTV
jgi:hypothetical protein